jgi:7-carboxy-7-deazaguanine synthase
VTQLKVFEIFYSLQGESSRVGLLMIFIRLSGCPMRCHYCDTACASFSRLFHDGYDEIMSSIQKYDTPYVTVTGGEPLAQKEVLNLLKTLADNDYEVSLETGGGLSI